jgi:hypothetical protein
VAAIAGVLVYDKQPLVIVVAQSAAPENSAAAACVVMGIGFGIAGLRYAATGALRGLIGLAPAMTLTFTLLIPPRWSLPRALPSSA